jgi:hypothetical protein
MSDGLGYEQANVMSSTGAMPPGYPGGAMARERADPTFFGDRPPAARLEVTPGELRLRHLTGSWEIAEVAHLRRQIQLPAAVLADPEFAALEKKETGSAWSRHSSGATSPWAP